MSTRRNRQQTVRRSEAGGSEGLAAIAGRSSLGPEGDGPAVALRVRLISPLAVPKGTLQRGPNKLAPFPHAGFEKQLLHRELDCALRNAEIAGNSPVGQAFENSEEHLLLPFRQEVAGFPVIHLQGPVSRLIGQKLDDPPIQPERAVRN